MVVIYILDVFTGGLLSRLGGIHPRNPFGLVGIVTSPFLHGGIWHLINNLIGLSVFSFLCLLRGERFFISSSASIILLTGALVWIFARNGNHIGASGWIFGLWSLSIALAWFERSVMSILIGIFVVIFYGGMVFGVLPTRSYISFEAHLFGAIAGVITAAAMAKKSRASD